MAFLVLVALVLAAYAWNAGSKVSQRRKQERAAFAAYYQQELDRLRHKRDAEDARKRWMKDTQRLAEDAEAKRFAAAERRERYY